MEYFRPWDLDKHLSGCLAGAAPHRHSTNTLSRQAPLPSMLIVMPLVASTLVKAEPVNCEPWSVLRISGLP